MIVLLQTNHPTRELTLRRIIASLAPPAAYVQRGS